jgi:hypothetical protein
MTRRVRKERFSREQKDWIARARAAPMYYKAAVKEAQIIVNQLQANARRNRSV